MIFPNISNFIQEYITKREKSFFFNDIMNNHDKLMSQINGKSILVIGGAGTIGSYFIKSALKFFPSRLTVVDINENGLTELSRTLRSDSSVKVPENYLTYPMSFNSEIFYKILENNEPFDIVANFAAHKHVRSEKDNFSIEAMLRNNVIHAKRFMDYLKLNKPSHFFCVSTDKAANPVNVMGASKKLMEKLIMSYSDDFKVSTARFANVAFSNGSLLDGYLKRFLHRQPISCPSDVKRFFVSPEESGEICLLTCILANTGEIFFPKLNENHLKNFRDITLDFFKFLKKEIKIFKSEDEAKKYSSEMNDNSPYPIFFFKTDTSGEKLYEEFYTNSEIINIDKFESIGFISNMQKSDHSELNIAIEKLNNLFETQNFQKQDIVNLLIDLIPNFAHIETGKNLDQKM